MGKSHFSVDGCTFHLLVELWFHPVFGVIIVQWITLILEWLEFWNVVHLQDCFLSSRGSFIFHVHCSWWIRGQTWKERLFNVASEERDIGAPASGSWLPNPSPSAETQWPDCFIIPPSVDAQNHLFLLSNLRGAVACFAQIEFSLTGSHYF